ncbi:MAG: porin [bacterium]
MKKFYSFCIIILLTGVHVYGEEDQDRMIPDIQVSGYVQGVYASIHNDVQINTDTFKVNRARLGVHIEISSAITGFVSTELTGSELADAFISYVPYAWIGLRCGQMKIPLTYEARQSEPELDFIEYSRPVQELVISSPGLRDAGAQILSNGSFWDAVCMISNGSGANTEDQDEHKAFSGRASVCKDHMSIGGSLYRTKRLHVTGVEENIVRYAGEIQIGDETGFLRSEYILGKEGKIKKDGLVITGDTGMPFVSPMAYHMIPLRFMIRFEQWDPNTKIDDDAESLVVFGLRYPVNRLVRVDINYTIVQEETEAQIKNNRFAVQGQLRF